MDTLNLWIKYRPLRIGWCLRNDDFESMRKAMRLTHTMWGGRFNPIIPVDDWELAKQLVKLFRVDFLFSLNADENVQAFIDRFPCLPNPLFPKELFLKASSGRTYTQVLDIYHPLRYLYNEHFKNNPNPTFHACLYDWDDSDPLADILLATFGGFPPIEYTGIDYRGLIEKYIDPVKIKIGNN